MSEEQVKPRRRWYLRAAWHMAIFAFIVGGSCAVNYWAVLFWDWTYAQYAEAYQWAEKRMTREVVVREFIDPDTVPTEMLIDQVAAEEGLPAELLKAMALKESGRFNSTNRVRFEPHIYKKYQRVIPDNLHEIERQLWASSHGIMQVIWLYHRKVCGLENKDWTVLHDPLTNIRCGARVFKERWGWFKDIKNPGDRLFMALRSYNGDVEIPDTADYANHILANMTTLRVSEVMGRLK